MHVYIHTLHTHTHIYIKSRTWRLLSMWFKLHLCFWWLHKSWVIYPLLDKPQEAPEKHWFCNIKQVWANESRSRVPHPSRWELCRVRARQPALQPRLHSQCRRAKAGDGAGRLLPPEKSLLSTTGRRETTASMVPLDVKGFSDLFRLE